MDIKIIMVVLIGCLIAPGLSTAATVTVASGGGQDYTTIWEALDNVAPDDTVLVYSGNYFGDSNHVIEIHDTSLTIKSVIKHGATIRNANFLATTNDFITIDGFEFYHDSTPKRYSFHGHVGASDITISNCSVQWINNRGFRFYGTRCEVRDCEFTACDQCIRFFGTSATKLFDMVIDGCTIEGIHSGQVPIFIADCNTPKVQDVTIQNVVDSVALYIKDTHQPSITNVQIINNNYMGTWFDDVTNPILDQMTYSNVGTPGSTVNGCCIRADSTTDVRINGSTFNMGSATALHFATGSSYNGRLYYSVIEGLGNGIDDTYLLSAANGASLTGFNVMHNYINAGAYTMFDYGGDITLVRVADNVIDATVYDHTKTQHSLQYWNVAPPYPAVTNIIGGMYTAGNAWSDYPGWDTTNDGIGDQHIPWYHDNAPLTNRWQIPGQTGVHGVTSEMIAGEWFPVASAEVNMYNGDTSYITYSDADGHWVFSNVTVEDLKNGTYYLTAKKDRYKVVSPFTINCSIISTVFKEMKMERDTGSFYSRHEVTFFVCNMWKVGLHGVDVTVKIQNLVDQVGETGTDGKITFVMFETESYTVTFTHPTIATIETAIIHPREEYYVIYTSRATYNPDQELTYAGNVEWFWESTDFTPPVKQARLNLTYIDYTNKTTQIRYWINDTKGMNIFKSVVNTSNHTFSNVLSNNNTTYVLHVSADHPDFPELAHSHIKVWSYVNRMVEFVGFSEDWHYATAAACVLIFVAMMFSGVSLPTGALVVTMLGWMFIWIEWISGTYLNYAMMVFATVIAIGYIMKRNEYMRS